MKQFKHPELINPLISEPVNESSNDRTNELSDVEIQQPLEQTKQHKTTQAKPANYQQHRILHPELSSSSLPSASDVEEQEEQKNVYSQTTLSKNQETQAKAQQSFLAKSKPTLGQQVLVNSALKRNRRHTLAKVW